MKNEHEKMDDPRNHNANQPRPATTAEALGTDQQQKVSADAAPTGDAVAKPERTIGNVNAEAGTVDFGNGESYSVKGLPPAAQAYCAVAGLRSLLRQGDRATVFGRLMSGTMTARKPAAPKELPPLRKAISLAMLDHAKKQGHALTQEDAEKTALGLDRTAAEAHRNDPLVAKHLAKLQPAPGLGTLFAGAETSTTTVA